MASLILHQPRYRDRSAKRPIIDAIKVGRSEDPGTGQAFTYYVVKTSDAGDKRSTRRRRTHLRSGKVLDHCNALLIDCQIYDRSESGARIRLIKDIVVPSAIRLYEDWPERLSEAYVVWRKDREIGLRFNTCAPPRGISRVQLAHLRGNSYTTRK